MSTDYAEKEREFLETLEADTGRGLAAWMDAITAQNFAARNEAIDWLRQQGFMFWKASWLERIHENGGRPIYGDAGAALAPKIAPIPAAPAPPTSEPPEAVEPIRPVPAPSPAPPSAAIDAEVDELLKKAKALAPLARFVLREIARSAPGCSFKASGNVVLIRRSSEFAVLAIGQKELKLGLALPGEAIGGLMLAAKFPAPAYRVASTITHMVVLTDARQVDAGLMSCVSRAASA